MRRAVYGPRASTGNASRGRRTLSYVRGITLACVGIVAASSIAGCWLAHGLEGGVDGGPPRDSATVDAPVDADARTPGPTCDRPLDEWAETELRIEGFGRGVARLRDGDRTWVGAYAPTDGLVHLVALDESRADPRIAMDLPLESARGVPVAGAMDEARVAIGLTSGDGGVLEIAIVDPDGRPLLSTAVMAAPAGASMVIRGARLGVAAQGDDPFFPTTLAVLDASGGDFFVLEGLDATDEVSIGLGRGLFSALVTRRGEGETRLFGVDERGVIDAGGIGVRLRSTTWDGAVALGVDEEGALVLRRSAARLERFVPPEPVGAPSLAMRAARAWVASPGAGPSAVFMTDEGRFLTREVRGAEVVQVALAHASARHRGAFVLSDGDDLRWIGWSCE